MTRLVSAILPAILSAPVERYASLPAEQIPEDAKTLYPCKGFIVCFFLLIAILLKFDYLRFRNLIGVINKPNSEMK